MDEHCGNCKFFKNRWGSETGVCRKEPKPIPKEYDDRGKCLKNKKCIVPIFQVVGVGKEEAVAPCYLDGSPYDKWSDEDEPASFEEKSLCAKQIADSAKEALEEMGEDA